MSQYRRFRDLARVGHGALLVFERILSKPASHKIIKQNIAINSAPKLFPATNVKQQPKIQLSSTTPSASSRPSSAPDIPKIDAKSTIQQVQDKPSISPLSMHDTQLDLTRNRNLVCVSCVIARKPTVLIYVRTIGDNVGCPRAGSTVHAYWPDVAFRRTGREYWCQCDGSAIEAIGRIE